MLIQGVTVTVFYKRIDGIKKVYYNNEHLLKSFFDEATVLPIPDDAPDEIPRIVIQTHHEHAKLSIAPASSTFEVRFDEGFEKQWGLCVDYIKERMKSVFSFMNILTNNDYNYIGVVSNVLYDEIGENGAKIITETLLNSKRIKDLYDINIRYTFVEEKDLFVNIMLQNARLFKSGLSMNEAGSLKIDNQIAESIGVIIDINDRFGYNNENQYHSNINKLDIILSTMGEIIEKKLSCLIEKGEYL